MNFIDKITGNDITRQMKEFDVRAEKLPEDFQNAFMEMQSYIAPASDLTGRNLMPIYEQALELLEIASVDGESLDEIFAGDIKGFCENLTADEKNPQGYDYHDKMARRLNERVAKKLGGLSNARY